MQNPASVLTTTVCAACCIQPAMVEMKNKHKSMNLTHLLCIYLATIYSTLDSKKKKNLDYINIPVFDEVKTAKLGAGLSALSIPSGIP